jgi:hypothetical protein
MPAYSFSLADFEWMIPQGAKVRTTRLMGDGMRFEQAKKAMEEERPARLYWKQRTKNCRLLLEAPIRQVAPVKFGETWHFSVNGRELGDHAMSKYANEEGFKLWGYFVRVIEDLHGEDFRDFDYYTVKWGELRPEGVPGA